MQLPLQYFDFPKKWLLYFENHYLSEMLFFIILELVWQHKFIDKAGYEGRIYIIKYFPSDSMLPPLKFAIRLKFFRDPAMPSRAAQLSVRSL